MTRELTSPHHRSAIAELLQYIETASDGSLPRRETRIAEQKARRLARGLWHPATYLCHEIEVNEWHQSRGRTVKARKVAKQYRSPYANITPGHWTGD